MKPIQQTKEKQPKVDIEALKKAKEIKKKALSDSQIITKDKSN